MTRQLQVTCSAKRTSEDVWDSVTHLGGVGEDGDEWLMDTATAIQLIEYGEIELYISDGWLSAPLLIGYGSGGKKYLRTMFDSESQSQLQALPDCR